ncbi:WD40/YVTN/BNR-like repeat-containing protein [Tenacibaculum piscium]|uniref:WD40/YVTN/BNR-like repeat-containing protein n=1 Tax=Tenacibaculum piscium TaxID=1458515 RepID=UPI001F438828|nr:YCF48-related protein [Tenacibaculum piscium]
MTIKNERRFYLLRNTIALFLLTVISYSCTENTDNKPLIEEIKITKIVSNTQERLERIQFLKGNKIGYITGQAGTLLKTTDSGETWTSLNTPLVDSKVYDWNSVWFNNEKTGFLVGSNTKKKITIYKTTDGATSWNEATVNGGSIDRMYDVAFTNSTTGFMVGYKGQIFKSTDTGATWNLITQIDTLSMREACVKNYAKLYPDREPSENTGTLSNTILYRLKVVSENEIYTAGRDGIVFKSIDAGNNWKYVNTGNINDIYDLNYINNSVLITCGKNGSVSKIYKDGTYQDLTNIANTRSFRGMHFITEDVGWCVGEHGYIYKTSNGGNYWGKEIAPTESTYILRSCAFINPQIGIFVGNAGQIIKIEDSSTENLTQQ